MLPDITIGMQMTAEVSLMKNIVLILIVCFIFIFGYFVVKKGMAFIMKIRQASDRGGGSPEGKNLHFPD